MTNITKAAQDAQSISNLRQLLIDAGRSISWQCFGECRAFDEFAPGPVRDPGAVIEDIRSALQDKAKEVRCEREAFESKWLSHGVPLAYFLRNEFGYLNEIVEASWKGWEARAAKGRPCLTCSGHGLVGGHMPDGSGHGEPCPDCNAPA